MKHIFKYLLFAGLFGSILAGCNDDEVINPSEVENLTSETRAGEIILRWDTPKDGSIDYIKVSYQDPRLKKEVTRLASMYADSILIPDTRARYPEYIFNVRSVSETETEGPIRTISQKSAPAALTTTQSQTEIVLTVDDLSTNAQESGEGPIKNLLDGDKTTFFHTSWSTSIPSPHWLQVNLKKTLSDHYKFYYAPRNNDNNKPIDFDLLGTTNGTDWVLIKNFTKEEDGLPTSKSEDYTSEVLPCTVPFSQIRISVNKTNNNTVYWTMSEFKFWEVKVNTYDPEKDEEEL